MGETVAGTADDCTHVTSGQLSTPQFLMASEALEDLVRLFAFNSTVPRRLFAGGTHMTKVDRLGQLAFGCIQLAILVSKCKSIAVVHGRGLAFLNGWIEVTVGRTWQTVWASISRLEPFLAVATSREEFFHVFTNIGLDPSVSLPSYPTQTGHIIFRGRRTGLPCIVHYGRYSAGRAAVTRHATGLAEAHVRLGLTLPGLLPEICLVKEVDNIEILIEHELAGLEPPIESASKAGLARMTKAALDPLHAIYRNYSSQQEFDGQAAIRDSSVLNDALLRHNLYQCLGPAFGMLTTWVTGRTIRAVPVHGDYAPRNLLFDKDFCRVVGIIDWEWFWARGPVGFDALQVILEIHAIRQGASLIDALAEFLRGNVQDDFLVRQTEYICESYEISRRDLWHVGLLIWLRVLWAGCLVTAPITPQWLENAVTTPAAAIAAMDLSLLHQARDTGS